MRPLSVDVPLLFRSESDKVAMGMEDQSWSFSLSIFYTVETASVLLD